MLLYTSPKIISVSLFAPDVSSSKIVATWAHQKTRYGIRKPPHDGFLRERQPSKPIFSTLPKGVVGGPGARTLNRSDRTNSDLIKMALMNSSPFGSRSRKNYIRQSRIDARQHCPLLVEQVEESADMDKPA